MHKLLDYCYIITLVSRILYNSKKYIQSKFIQFFKKRKIMSSKLFSDGSDVCQIRCNHIF